MRPPSRGDRRSRSARELGVSSGHSFYYTLVNKLRADKMCKGCSPPPHRFFRGNEGHPRPRCFNIHEVKPHPSLWETMTGLWRGKGKKSLINAAIYLETHE